MKKERKVNMILAIVLWLICIAMFLPMVFVIINSFKTFGSYTFLLGKLPKKNVPFGKIKLYFLLLKYLIRFLHYIIE